MVQNKERRNAGKIPRTARVQPAPMQSVARPDAVGGRALHHSIHPHLISLFFLNQTFLPDFLIKNLLIFKRTSKEQRAETIPLQPSPSQISFEFKI
jgi:hypothetical protein